MKDKLTNNRMHLPCGKCYECRARRVSGWSHRLHIEALNSHSCHWITLTYADPEPASVSKRDLQLFFKALRKTTTNKIKYYAVAEYGTETQRPHYHIVLFNAHEIGINASWQKGHVYFGKVELASIGYTLKYLTKEDPHEHINREQPFQLMSKGLGKAYLTPQMINYHKNDMVNRFCIKLKDGKTIPMPRYYKDKIYTKSQRKAIGQYHENMIQEHYNTTNLSTLSKEAINNDLIAQEKTRKYQKNGKRKDSLQQLERQIQAKEWQNLHTAVADNT